MASNKVSKSSFKAHALEYFRQIERTGRELVVTDRGRPVAKIVPLRADRKALLEGLRGTVRRYDRPVEPTGESWEALT